MSPLRVEPRRGSALDARHRRIVERLEKDLGGHAGRGDFELITSGKQFVAHHATLGIADIAVADGAADRVSVAAACEPARTLAVAIDRLAPEQENGRIGSEPGKE